MIVWLLACAPSTPTTTPEPVVVSAPTPPAPAPAPAPVSDQVYVRASTLNLRSGPSSTAPSLGQLTINTPLKRLATEGEWLQVEVGNGKQGWVGAAFVDPTVLTVDAAIEQARASTDPLSWWQRAAAIDPRRDVLEGLLEAYEAAGQQDRAEQVRAQLAWPHTMHLVWKDHDLPTNTVRIEWSTVSYDAPLRKQEDRDRWSAHGLEPDATWMLLSNVGPAVPARAVKMAVEEINPCSGERARIVWLEHDPLPEGAVPLVASRTAPPASWMVDLRPSTPAATVEAEVRVAAAGTLGKKPIEVRVQPVGATVWRGRARVDTGKLGELGDEIYDVVTVEWDAGKVTLGPKNRSADDDELAGIRDVVGSGEPMWILQSYCATDALDASGSHIKSTGYRCCGC